MSDTPQWFAPAASALGTQVDTLFSALVWLTGSVATAIAIAVVWFCIRYRRGSNAPRGAPQVRASTLEITWITVPLLVFFVIFAVSAAMLPRFYAAPPDADTVYVIGKQWMWKLEHRDGRRELDELHVARGRPVRLVMISQDVIHSFFVPALRFKQDLLPERYTSVVFTPTRTGVFGVGCAEFCGAQHSRMRGRLVVLEPAALERWLAAGGARTPLAERGFALYRELGCSGCHEPRSTVAAPPLHGLFGSAVHLADGRYTRADETYLRNAILHPSLEVVAGYGDIMPSFAGQLREEDMVALIAWLGQLR
ncbi:MAG TPA: c-type cytochrome [Steroidobacteraceae bacterium]|nr:c-type cytochrome [Steroidobacteraceae bacterium]